ncbi:MAG: decaprenyl-phosphate phosphoribosyltransferase [Anaerolineae bacterium]|jgi:4-hydroxybenzoate polyprenyltransferase
MRELLRAMRPKQWVKNAVIFSAIVFDAKLDDVTYLAYTAAGLVIFCLVSGTVYLINDLVDVDKDRQHPKKRHRPLASGRLSARVAQGAIFVVLLICLPSSFLLDPLFGGLVSAYLALQVAYSLWLKNVVIVDVLVLAAGFVLRVASGAALVDAERFSPWLYVCMVLLALFLGFSKRRGELVLLQENANNYRAILQEYSLPLLDEMISVVTATTVLAYSLYTFDPGNPHLPDNNAMMLTIPFVLYGIFRYLYLIHQKGETAPPDEVLLKDRPLQVTVGLWGLTALALLYLA